MTCKQDSFDIVCTNRQPIAPTHVRVDTIKKEEERKTEGTDALQECYLEVSGIAGAWKECDFNQRQETYPGGCLEGWGSA
jgi:hypothetical protein